jgi:hypothetical protein
VASVIVVQEWQILRRTMGIWRHLGIEKGMRDWGRHSNVILKSGRAQGKGLVWRKISDEISSGRWAIGSRTALS